MLKVAKPSKSNCKGRMLVRNQMIIQSTQWQSCVLLHVKVFNLHYRVQGRTCLEISYKANAKAKASSTFWYEAQAKL